MENVTPSCNAEYSECGNYYQHTHSCMRKSGHSLYHICLCGEDWMDIRPAKPESRCTCAMLLRCEWCLNREAEIQRLAAIGDKWKQYANDVTDAKNAEIQRLKADVAIDDDFVAALEAKVKSLAPHGTCACDYDRPGDVCAHHSPTVQRLTQELMLTTTRWHERWAEALDAQERNRDLSDALKVAVEAIENAPHDTRGFGCRGIGDCNCWKAEALSRIQESGGGE